MDMRIVCCMRCGQVAGSCGSDFVLFSAPSRARCLAALGAVEFLGGVVRVPISRCFRGGGGVVAEYVVVDDGRCYSVAVMLCVGVTTGGYKNTSGCLKSHVCTSWVCVYVSVAMLTSRLEAASPLIHDGRVSHLCRLVQDYACMMRLPWSDCIPRAVHTDSSRPETKRLVFDVFRLTEHHVFLNNAVE